MSNFLDDVARPFQVLAPMDDVTDTVFRRVVAEHCYAPDIFFTEFVNVDALQSPGRTSALRRLKFVESERPLVTQIWGKKPENFQKTAAELVAMGFDGVDINMGCPVHTVVKNGCGGGMIQHPEKAVEIIEATRRGLDGRLPLSVKTRIGFKEFDETWLTTLLEQKLNMLTIHLRTVKEMSKVPAHWELASRVVTLRDRYAPQTLIVGNGDIESYAQAKDMAKKSGMDGVMVGRGVFKDPFVFSPESPWPSLSPSQKVDLFSKHLAIFEESWKPGEKPLAPLNKFCKIYINDFPNAKDYREKLMACKTIGELKSTLETVRSELLR